MSPHSRPRTRYARSGSLSVAYQTVGDGEEDLVWVPGIVSHLDAAWNDPEVARGYERLATMRRLILFDKRGTGMSDRVPPGDLPSFDERIDDIRAVMDAAGSERAAIFAWSEGAALACLFAATYPERVERLILYGGFARNGDADGYDIGRPDELRARVTKRLLEKWAEIDAVHELWAPSRAGDAGSGTASRIGRRSPRARAPPRHSSPWAATWTSGRSCRPCTRRRSSSTAKRTSSSHSRPGSTWRSTFLTHGS